MPKYSAWVVALLFLVGTYVANGLLGDMGIGLGTSSRKHLVGVVGGRLFWMTRGQTPGDHSKGCYTWITSKEVASSWSWQFSLERRPASQYRAVTEMSVFVPIWAGLLAVICAMATVSLARRRSQSPPPSCLTCAYPMEGLEPGARCPECGHAPPDTRSNTPPSVS